MQTARIFHPQDTALILLTFALAVLAVLALLALSVESQRRARQAWAERLARESERRVNTLLDHATELIAIVDQAWTIRYLNGAARQFAAAPLAAGGVLLALFEPAAWEAAGALMREAAAQPGQPVRAALRGAGAAESWFELSLNDQSADRAIGGAIVNLRDITEQKQSTAQIEAALAQAREAARLAEAQAAELHSAHAATRAAEDHAQELEKAHAARRAAEEQANRLARHDALTGLSNRRVFTTELEAAFQRARSGAGYSSLILIDLDGFKKINDLHGHHVGDAVLCEVARRLEMTMRKNDSVARLGGDEFAIIAEGRLDLEEHQAGALRLAGRVLSAIQLPMTTPEGRLEVGACLGIAFCRAEAPDTGHLLHAADIAMYRAKQHGRGTFRFFEQRMDDEMREKEAIERELMTAVAEETIQPYFMPLVDIARGRVCGFEALARWHHKERGFIPPDVFIPVVEQLGLMAELTNSVLRQACRAAREWPEEIRVAVNFSPSELKDPLLPSRILAILTQEGLAAARLEVEITETALITDTEAAKATLATLQGFGVTICLDDFGTGYSSLSHLRELRFDRVKIDRSFIQAMQENPDSEKIVDAILGLTRSLTLPAVAEGIENQAVLSKLAGKGCEFGQGYHFGKAMTAAAAGAMLQAGLAPARAA
jgi:diguanylate cyclase (GGDEF)-like protein